MAKPTSVNFINDSTQPIKIKASQENRKEYKNFNSFTLRPGEQKRVTDSISGGLDTPDIWVDVIVNPDGPNNSYKLDEWKFDNPWVGDPIAEAQKAVFYGSTGLHKRPTDIVLSPSDRDVQSKATAAITGLLSNALGPFVGMIDDVMPSFMHKFRRITKEIYSPLKLLSRLQKFNDRTMDRQNKAYWTSAKDGADYIANSNGKVSEWVKGVQDGALPPFQFPASITRFETEAFRHDNGAKFWDLHITDVTPF